MATLAQLESALVGADRAGDMDAARRLAAAVVEARKDRSNLIPDSTVAGTLPQPPEPTLGKRAVGAGEAALALGTGLVGGTVGMLGGALGGLAASANAGEMGTQAGTQGVEHAAMESAAGLTYQPRTTLGQEITQAGAEVLQSLIPVMPLTAEMGAAAAGAKAGTPVAAAIAQEAARPAVQALGKVAAPAVAAVRSVLPGAAETVPRGTSGSIGAAAVEMPTLRAEKAANLPSPVNLTRGAETRDAAQLAFEKEQIKGPLGAPLRARAEENNLQALQNFDAVIDLTGAQTPDIAASGSPVVKALSEGWKEAKNRTRVAYNKAENSPEAFAEVDAGPIIEHLNSIPSGLKTTGLSDHAKQYAVRLGIATIDENGNLVPAGAKQGFSLDERAIQEAMASVRERPAKDIRPTSGQEFSETSLLQEIKNKGGINVDQIRDLTGESRAGAGRKGLPPTLFTKSGQDLGDLATALRDEGWNIPVDSVDGGVQALRDLIQEELRGNKQYSIAATDRLAMHEYEQRMFEDSGMSMTEAERAQAFNLAVQHTERTAGNWNSLSEEAKNAHLDKLFGEDTRPAGPAPVEGAAGGASGVQGPSRPVGAGESFKTNVKTLEAWRKEISQATGFKPVEIRDATILKKLIDAQTEPVSGPLYQQARALRTQQARKYENRAVVARLITDKRGMTDPKVAVDQVFRTSILNGSPEEITFLKRVLLTSGEDGQQAWKEMQGATMQHIRAEATKGMGMDSADRPLVSPAKLRQTVSALDKNGRLDIVLGKKSAQIVRDLNDVVRYVNTTPPGTLINNSGTVGTLLAAISEAGISGTLFGLPIPILSSLRLVAKGIQNQKMKSKINHALNIKKASGG